MHDEPHNTGSDAVGEPALKDTLECVREAERELAQARQAEELAEVHLEEVVEELEPAERHQHRESEIIVNGRRRTIPGHVVSYEEVVKLAFPNGPNKPNTKFTVTYRNAAQVPAMGEMDPSQTVKVKPGCSRKDETIFNVTETVLS